MRFGLILESDNDTTPARLDKSLRLGPLRFPAPLSELGESLGDGLEAIGAALVMGERRARPFKLELAVHGYYTDDPDPREAGLRLRRQLRQLLENAAWRKHGLYLYWPADPELSGWLMVGGGDLTETDPGITFGEFTLELTDCYFRGRPGSHRPGRRINIADRRTGLVPLDTRGLLYSTAYAAEDADSRAVLPGNIAGVTTSTGDAPTPRGTSPLVGGRLLYSTFAATDGDVLSYVPDLPVLAESAAQAQGDLDTPGMIRGWDTRGTTVPVQGTADDAVADADPTTIGWEGVYGPLIDYTTPLAVDNGTCRLVWIPLAGSAGGGLALDTFDAATYTYTRLGRFIGLDPADLANAEAAVLELTPERAVLEWRTAGRALRAILQRGWTGPRLEHYTTAPLQWAPSDASGALTTGGAHGIDGTYVIGDTVRWIAGQPSDVLEETFGDGFVPVGAQATPAAGSVLVAQIAPLSTSEADTLSLALLDVRAEPVLLRRGA